MGYLRPATPATLARNLHQLANRLEDEGDKALWRAETYAARGYPHSTIGADGGRSSSTDTSTERAALTPTLFDDIDTRLVAQMVLAGTVANRIHDILDVVMTHASDDDPIKPGTGKCRVEACGHICRHPDRGDRLQAKYCPACYRRWVRWGRPDKATFERQSGPEFT